MLKRLVSYAFCILFSLTAFASECPDWLQPEASSRLKALATEIQKHDDLYHNQHAPIISDEEYDALVLQQKELHDCFPLVLSPDKFTPELTGLLIAPHKGFMGSLKKAASAEDIKHFISRIENGPILLQPKIDGIAIELFYQNGKLASVSTRGNGKQGSDITALAGEIPLIPPTINFNEEVILHGELFVRLDKIDQNVLQAYASARHFVAGQIRQKEPNPEHLQFLDFFPWRWVNSPYQTDNQTITALQTLGFQHASDYTHRVRTVSEVTHWRKYYADTSNHYPFLMDGIVLKPDNLSLRSRMGWNQQFPLWSIAWKFPAKSGATRVSDIEFHIGSTGQITPVLILEPVNIQGETIRRVSLGSIQNLKKKDIATGDRISIQLKGAATPVFHRLLIRATNRKQPVFPDQNQYNAFSCLSYSQACEQQLTARLVRLTGRKGLNLPELDKHIIQRLIQNGVIHNLSRILVLHEKELLQAGMSETQTRQYLLALQSLQKIPFQQQLMALSLPGIGKSKARKLSGHFRNWAELRNASDSHLLASETMASETMASGKMATQTIKNLRKYLQAPEVKQIIELFE